MRGRTMLLLMLVAVLMPVSLGRAETDYKALLVGKWEGNVTERSMKDASRTLVIRSIAKGESPLAVRATYGTPGASQSRADGTLDTSGARPVLHLTTSGGSEITLTLHDEKNLIGTIKGKGDVRTPPALRLQKAE